MEDLGSPIPSIQEVDFTRHANMPLKTRTPSIQTSMTTTGYVRLLISHHPQFWEAAPMVLTFALLEELAVALLVDRATDPEAAPRDQRHQHSHGQRR